MDGVIEDIAAVGVDHVDRHLAAAVVHLVAHGSVAVNLGIAQHEVITFPLDGIAPRVTYSSERTSNDTP